MTKRRAGKEGESTGRKAAKGAKAGKASSPSSTSGNGVELPPGAGAGFAHPKMQANARGRHRSGPKPERPPRRPICRFNHEERERAIQVVRTMLNRRYEVHEIQRALNRTMTAELGREIDLGNSTVIEFVKRAQERNRWEYEGNVQQLAANQLAVYQEIQSRGLRAGTEAGLGIAFRATNGIVRLMGLDRLMRYGLTEEEKQAFLGGLLGVLLKHQATLPAVVLREMAAEMRSVGDLVSAGGIPSAGPSAASPLAMLHAVEQTDVDVDADGDADDLEA